jgi:hypothetical protein
MQPLLRTFLFAANLFDGIDPNKKCPAPHETDTCGAQFSDILHLIQNAINYALFLAGMLAIVFVIIGGIRYALSQGNPQALQQAKKTLTYAIVGLLVSGMAFAIVNFFSLGGKGLFQ